MLVLVMAADMAEMSKLTVRIELENGSPAKGHNSDNVPGMASVNISKALLANISLQ